MTEASATEESADNRRRHPRTPLSLLVQYRSDTFEDFLAEYSVNLSPGGIFLRTDAPHPLGAMIFLQFFLKDGSRLIEGLGRVVHVNTPEEIAQGRVPGMGIEFLGFDETSRALVEEICAAKRAKSDDGAALA